MSASQLCLKTSLHFFAFSRFRFFFLPILGTAHGSRTGIRKIPRSSFLYLYFSSTARRPATFPYYTERMLIVYGRADGKISKTEFSLPYLLIRDDREYNNKSTETSYRLLAYASSADGFVVLKNIKTYYQLNW